MGGGGRRARGPRPTRLLSGQPHHAPWSGSGAHGRCRPEPGSAQAGQSPRPPPPPACLPGVSLSEHVKTTRKS